MPSEDTKTFVNPTGYWEHNGAFSVELVASTPTGNLRVAPRSEVIP